jgi:hypothetical protein
LGELYFLPFLIRGFRPSHRPSASKSSRLTATSSRSGCKPDMWMQRWGTCSSSGDRRERRPYLAKATRAF